MKRDLRENRTPGTILLNMLIAAASLFVNGFGVYLTIQANIGAGPWDVLNIGFSRSLGILYGTASIAVSLSILLIDTYANYCFSAKTCKKCPLREQCKVGKSKTHTYNITQPDAIHQARLDFENSEEFKKKLEVRHRIEEKNGEMKTAHGFHRADSVGLIAMRLQAYLTAVVVNMKRIVAVIPS